MRSLLGIRDVPPAATVAGHAHAGADVIGPSTTAVGPNDVVAKGAAPDAP
jgi:hypothetical protein